MADVTCTVLKVFSEGEGRSGPVRIQVVSWNKYNPVLEKREYYRDKKGAEKTGKAKGFNFEDFRTLLDNSEEIQDLLEKEAPIKD